MKFIENCKDCKTEFKIRDNYRICGNVGCIQYNKRFGKKLTIAKTEEEWYCGKYWYQYYLWDCFIIFLISYGERIKGMSQSCPVCYQILFEKRAGFYCYNQQCPAFGLKAITCCEGELC